MNSDIKSKLPEEKIKNFCKKHNIKKMSLFGSALRDEFTDDSDIDILVEFDKNNIPSFFDLYDMEQELSEFFNGRKVDLWTPNDLSKYFRGEVGEKSEVIYITR